MPYFYWNRPLGEECDVQRLTICSARAAQWTVPFTTVTSLITTEVGLQGTRSRRVVHLQIEGSSLLREADWCKLCASLQLHLCKLRIIRFLNNNGSRRVELLLRQFPPTKIRGIHLEQTDDQGSILQCILNHSIGIQSLSLTLSASENFDLIQRLLPRLRLLRLSLCTCSIKTNDAIGWELVKWLEEENNNETVIECSGLSGQLQEYLDWLTNSVLLSRLHPHIVTKHTAMRVIQAWYRFYHRPPRETIISSGPKPASTTACTPPPDGICTDGGAAD